MAPKRIGRWGVGPLFTVLSLSYTAVALGVSMSHRSFFRMTWLPGNLRWGLVAVLGTAGIVFFAVAVRDFARAYRSDELKTDGAYAWCRHPIYASWTVFLVPALVLAADSWLGLTVPVVMAGLLRILATREEAELERHFGGRYRSYRSSVPFILPVGGLLRFAQRK